jgi:predicted permease
MRTLRSWLWRFAGLFHQNPRDREIDEELESHLQLHVDENLRAGMTPEEARRHALLALGGVQQTKEGYRDRRGLPMLEAILQDVRFGLRMLRKNSVFTAVAVLTLALGIGANTAIFSVVDAALLRSLPFPHEDRLVWAWGNFGTVTDGAVSPPDFVDYRTQVGSFDHFSAFHDQLANLTADGNAQQIEGAIVSAGFFETLGAKPLLGRTFSFADEQVTRPQTAVLSYGFWESRFGGNTAVIGKTVTVEGGPATIIGIMPSDFDYYPLRVEAWFPISFLSPTMQQRPSSFLRVIGMLKPGVTLTQAQSNLDAIASRLGEEYPSTNKGLHLRLEPMRNAIVGSARNPLLVLSGAVALILLIACANVANLFLSRNTARQKEIVVRTALGATQRRIVTQLLTESVMLGLMGGIVGLVLAAAAMDTLRSLAPADVPFLDTMRLNGAVLAFAAILSFVTGIAFGIAPAMFARGNLLGEVLREGGRSSQAKGGLRLQNVLVVSEVVLSTTLLIGAGLLLNSLWRMIRVRPGFDSTNVLTSHLLLPTKTYSEENKRTVFFHELIERLGASPMVQAAGAISSLPLGGQYNSDYFTTAPSPPQIPQASNIAEARLITGDYFQAMQIPLLQGRAFTDQDQPNSRLVVIVNEPFIRRYIPDGNAIGKHLLVYQGAPGFLDREIIGIVGGTSDIGLQSAPPAIMYASYSQSPNFSMNITVRGAGDPGALSSAIRSAVASIDPDVSLSAFQTMGEIAYRSVAWTRFNALLLAAFGGVALTLAAAGIYGLISYTVAQRTHEIGIRLALGAERNRMLRFVLLRGMKWVVVGLALGIALAATLTQVLVGQLYGVKASDPVTFAAVIVILGLVALLACYIPARRALCIDPAVALRHE